jgi:hypothetical protein
MPYPFPYLHFGALILIFATSAVVPASLAIWAGTSNKVHWFWRALAIWAITIAPIAFRGYELAGILAITLPLLVLAVAAVDRFLLSRDSTWSQKSSVRFPLRDVFILTLLAALILAAFLRWWREIHLLGSPTNSQWAFMIVQFGLAGTVFWTLSLLSWFTARRRRLLGGGLLFLAVIGFAYAVPLLGQQTLFGVREPSIPPWQALGLYFRPGPLGPAPGILLEVFAAFAVCMIAALAITKRLTHSPLTYSPLTVLLAAPLLALAFIYIQLIWLTPLPPMFTGDTNHYARLTEIMEQCEQLAKTPTPKSTQQRQQLLAEAFVLLQDANFIPYDPVQHSTDGYAFNQFVDRHNRFRILARSIDEDAAVALSNDEVEKALQEILAEIRIGAMLQRGATHFDAMTANMIHIKAQEQLARLRRDLSVADARRVLADVDRAAAERENLDAVTRRTRALTERSWGWTTRLHHVIEDCGLGSRGTDAAYVRATSRDSDAAFHLLQADLAIRLYRAEHGDWPPSLGDLVPSYLSAVPIDPHSGRPLLYRPEAEDFVLYSVGKDRTDDHGRFTNRKAYAPGASLIKGEVRFDFDLDTFTRP